MNSYTEIDFHSLADASLEHMLGCLEPLDQNGTLTVDCLSGVLTIELESGKQFIVSKHAPSRQLWLSSPVSGGVHFTFDGKSWALADGRTLDSMLAHELKLLVGAEVQF